ncbi:MAG: hypothetical protein HY077_18085 [Elusimicrobia bacterium]|nr:hypothetical protein [Elusimicrobiota bacterium]
MRPSRLTGLAAAASTVVVASRFFATPALIDAATGQAFPGRLEFPLSHLLLTPFSSFADIITCNSARQDIALTVLVLAGFGLFRFFILGHGGEGWFDRHDILVAFALYIPLAAGYFAWAVLWPHAPPRLVPEDPDAMPVDFHSHTSLSWDGRRSFTPERNAAWHDAAGFGASFITDHNVFEPGASNGEEVSLHDAHVVVLGNSAFADRRRYTDDEEGVRTFLSRAKADTGGLTILSLPEYWRHYWGAPLERLAQAGADGLEIWTSSPKAMDFPPAKRREAVELCRRRGLFMAGATDNHGYGSCACVWNIVTVPAWRLMDRRARERAALDALRSGSGAVRVAVRRGVEPAAGDAIVLDGFRAVMLMVRLWTPPQCLFALAWFWGLAWARPSAGRRRK